jgi:hypothetical protein
MTTKTKKLIKKESKKVIKNIPFPLLCSFINILMKGTCTYMLDYIIIMNPEIKELLISQGYKVWLVDNIPTDLIYHNSERKKDRNYKHYLELFCKEFLSVELVSIREKENEYIIYESNSKFFSEMVLKELPKLGFTIK